MRQKNRVSILVGAVMALFLLAQSAHALTLPGFSVHAPTIKPVKRVQLCSKTMHVAGITITVPSTCKDTPPPPPVVPQLTLAATPTSITAGQNATLAWDSTDATSCTASGSWTGVKALDGGESVSPAATANYVLTCVNGANSVAKNVTVTVVPVPTTGTLIVEKVLTQNDGRTDAITAFSFQVNGGTATAFAVGGQNSMTVEAGTYSVVEVANANYTTTYSNCTNVSVTAGGTATCIITNDDIAPAPTTATLTLTKTVINNNGGTATDANFQAKIDGGNVAWGSAQTVAIGVHTASETGMTGYTASAWGGDCAADGTITLAGGENKTCSITNDDRAGTLVVKKVLTQDNGRTETATAFSFQVNGGAATAFEADGQNDVTVNAGTYSVVEVADANYTTTYENCTDVVIPIGGTATCTITNNDVAPVPTTGTLVVDKVTQPTGDTTEFAISATGSGAITGGGSGTVSDASNKSYEVAPGTYAVAETAMDGWQIVSNTCADVIVAAGETKTCVITNAKLPKLTVTKVVVNDDLGNKQAADFALFVGATPVTSGVQITGTIGAHTVSETPDSGYTGVISGDCAADGSITLAAGDVKSCTITNNDNVPVPPVGALLITEVAYDLGADKGSEPGNEWVELYNGTNSDINLSGYVIRDATGFDTLPDIVLPAGKFAFITGSSTTAGLWSLPVDTVVIVLPNSTIGGGLGNSGDRVVLENASAVQFDAMSWGSDTTVFSPSVPDVADGHSIARASKTTDTNVAADWVDLETPTPGL